MQKVKCPDRNSRKRICRATPAPKDDGFRVHAKTPLVLLDQVKQLRWFPKYLTAKSPCRRLKTPHGANYPADIQNPGKNLRHPPLHLPNHPSDVCMSAAALHDIHRRFRRDD